MQLLYVVYLEDFVQYDQERLTEDILSAFGEYVVRRTIAKSCLKCSLLILYRNEQLLYVFKQLAKELVTTSKLFHWSTARHCLVDKVSTLFRHFNKIEI